MYGVTGSSGLGLKRIRCWFASWKPARSIAAPVSREQWQPAVSRG
jgi:hypothetical protein